MLRSMSINNCFFDKSRFWQGFPSENRLKSQRESRIRRKRQRLPSNDLIETARPAPAHSCKRFFRGSSDRDLMFAVRDSSCLS